MKNIYAFVLCCALLSIVAFSCQKADIAAERARRAEKSTGDIRIAAVGNWSQDNKEAKAWNGIEMAVDEINRTGVIAGRKFVLLKKDDKGTIDGGLLAAEEVSGDPDIVAVIGHAMGFSTVPSSVVYEEKGLLLVSPIVSSPELLERNNKLIIDVQVTTVAAAKYLAEFAGDKGYREIAMIYVYDDYGTRFATEFEKNSAQLGIKIIDVIPFSAGQTGNFDAIMRKLKNYDFDALLFAGYPKDTENFVTKIRLAGINKPILTDTTLGVAAAARCGKYMHGVVTTSYFDTDPEDRISQEFRTAYSNRYGLAPDRYSANGYEAVKLLAEGIKKAGSTVPAKVATALRTIKDWQGLSGKYSIGMDGGIEGKPISLVEFRDGRFVKVQGK